MKSFMKKVIMGALALAIVVSSIVSRPEVVKAGIKADGAGRDDDIWVFKIIPTVISTDKILILTQTYVSEHRPDDTVEYNAKLLYDTSGYDEPAELLIGKNAFRSDIEVKTVIIETECFDREGYRNPAGVLNIGEDAFNDCHILTEINCQPNVKIKTIDQYAFKFCRELKTIDLTEVETIGDDAFYACELLEKIKFNKVTEIMSRAFADCTSLEVVDFGDWDADTCTIAANAFKFVGSATGTNNPVLKLPANWPEGDLPTSVGSKVPWHGGYFDYSPIESVSLNKSSITLELDKNESLVATVEYVPNKLASKEVKWTSSDESVATVDDTGKVTAVARGSATITANSIVDPRKKDTCDVTVLPKHVTEDNIEIVVDDNGDLSSVVDTIKSITEQSSSEATPVVTLKMDKGVTKVTKEVFEALKESDEDIKIVLDMGNCKWTFDSADITGTPTDIDFSVKIGDDAQTIAVDIINEVTGKRENKSVNITLAHSGDFKCKPTLTINLEEENKGYYANLFYYNPSSKKLEYVCAGKIKSNGEVDLEFAHASDYAIIISDRDMDPDNSGKNESIKSGDKKREENPSFTHPDRDKLKSVLPQKTITVVTGTSSEELKALTASDVTKANQTLLVNNFAKQVGKKARILATYSIHTNRMLGLENGKARTLKWTSLEKKQQVVYACCYNQTDKAYFIQGILDKNGTATFSNFLLRDATNVTIFVLE